MEPIENEGERTSKRVHGQSCDRATGRLSETAIARRCAERSVDATERKRPHARASAHEHLDGA